MLIIIYILDCNIAVLFPYFLSVIVQTFVMFLFLFTTCFGNVNVSFPCQESSLNCEIVVVCVLWRPVSHRNTRIKPPSCGNIDSALVLFPHVGVVYIPTSDSRCCRFYVLHALPLIYRSACLPSDPQVRLRSGISRHGRHGLRVSPGPALRKRMRWRWNRRVSVCYLIHINLCQGWFFFSENGRFVFFGKHLRRLFSKTPEREREKERDTQTHAHI